MDRLDPVVDDQYTVTAAWNQGDVRGELAILSSGANYVENTTTRFRNRRGVVLFLLAAYIASAIAIHKHIPSLDFIWISGPISALCVQVIASLRTRGK
jgi:hypothetical protein